LPPPPPTQLRGVFRGGGKFSKVSALFYLLCTGTREYICDAFENLCLLGILAARALLQLLLPPWKRARARASERASERESTRARASERVSERAKERESLEKFSKVSGLSYLLGKGTMK